MLRCDHGAKWVAMSVAERNIATRADTVTFLLKQSGSLECLHVPADRDLLPQRGAKTLPEVGTNQLRKTIDITTAQTARLI